MENTSKTTAKGTQRTKAFRNEVYRKKVICTRFSHVVTLENVEVHISIIHCVCVSRFLKYIGRI